MAKLEIQNLEVAVEDKTVVSDVSFAVNSGEVHVVMGRNGSGKSSVLNAIMGHPAYQITRGAVTLDGEDMLALPTEERARRGVFLSLQYTPELAGVGVASFLHKTAEALTGQSVPAMEFHRGLKERAAKFGAEGLLSREVNVGFSGGEKKLLEVLLLALVKPKFALLDEIDSGVDIDAQKRIFAALRALRDDTETGFVLVSHAMHILDHIKPDQVHIMTEGRITRSGGSNLIAEIREHGFHVAGEDNPK